MTTQATYALPHDASQTNAQPDANALNADNGLWTDGLPDRDKVRRRMQQTADRYIASKFPDLPRDRWQHLNELKELHRRQNEFYAEMNYYEQLLYAAPVLPLQAESTTTIVPYTPRPKPKRGRPSTGGRKPKPTTRKGRRNEEDSD